MSYYQDHLIKGEEQLKGNDVPYVENFPMNIRIPEYIVPHLRAYGNTVVSNKLVKKLGWNGIQWHLAHFGLKVTVVKTNYGNFIVEVIKRAKKEF